MMSVREGDEPENDKDDGYGDSDGDEYHETATDDDIVNNNEENNNGGKGFWNGWGRRLMKLNGGAKTDNGGGDTNNNDDEDDPRVKAEGVVTKSVNLSNGGVVDSEGRLQSYAGVAGEWETRQISIMGVVKRFISQLSYGQDLTKISMPSEFLNPYSVLEFVSLRYLTRFPILLEANAQPEPHIRMLHVIRWFLTSLVEAKMYKKPYNPVVCETHSCYIEHDGGTTHFVGEQVTHHPPVSAIHVNNPGSGVSLQGTISFGVKFWLNSVTINTTGYINVKMEQHNNEVYFFKKALPDLNLKNVVFGTRRMRWQNSIEIVCEKTNCEAEIVFDQSGNDETLHGKIMRDGETVISLDGSLDSEVYYRDVNEDDEPSVLFTCDKDAKHPAVHIPAQNDPYPSLKVWKDVSRYIVENNMTEADKAKTLVEEEQRTRTRQGEDEKTERRYFILDDELGRWVHKEGSFKFDLNS